MIEYDHNAGDRLTITVTGGSDIFRFAVNMLDDQTEFCEIGRAILVEQRERVRPKRFDAWARSVLGDDRFKRLRPYFMRDRYCVACESSVTEPTKAQRLKGGKVACRRCVSMGGDDE